MKIEVEEIKKAVSDKTGLEYEKIIVLVSLQENISVGKINRARNTKRESIIHKLCKEFNVSQNMLAILMGKSPAWITGRLDGKKKRFTPSELQKIYAFFEDEIYLKSSIEQFAWSENFNKENGRKQNGR